MIAYRSLTYFVLLCTISFSSITFGSAPAAAARPSSPDPIDAQLAEIDAMSDEDALCAIVPSSIDEANQGLVKNKLSLARSKHEIAKLCAVRVQRCKFSLKHWITDKEIASCNDNARKQKLIGKRDECHAQCKKFQKAAQADVAALAPGHDYRTMVHKLAYNFTVVRLNCLSYQASIVLAQKEEAQKKDAQWREKYDQAQQKNKALEAKNRNLQAFIDGPQIEGVPNIPGGIMIAQQKKKRSSSAKK